MPNEADERLVASEESLKEQLKSETLLVDMSARFVNLPADRIDSEIEDAQRRICELWILTAPRFGKSLRESQGRCC